MRATIDIGSMNNSSNPIAVSSATNNATIDAVDDSIDRSENWVDLRSDPSQRWVLFSPTSSRSSTSQAQSLYHSAQDPVHASIPSMPRHDGRGRFSTASSSSNSSDHRSEDDEFDLSGDQRPMAGSRSSSSSWVHHSHARSPQAHSLDLSNLASSDGDQDEMLSIPSSVSVAGSESLLGSRRWSSSSLSSQDHHQRHPNNPSESHSPPIRSGRGSVTGSVGNRSRDSRPQSPRSKHRHPLPSSASSNLSANRKIGRRNSTSSRSRSSSSTSKKMNRSARLSKSDGETSNDTKASARFRGQAALRFLTKVATKIMDVDAETMVMITESRPQKLIEEQPSLSSSSSSSTLSYYSSNGDEMTSRNNQNRVTRKIQLLIGDVDSASNQSDDSSNEVGFPMDLSRYYPLKSYSESEEEDEDEDEDDQMSSSVSTIKRAISINHRSQSLTSLSTQKFERKPSTTTTTSSSLKSPITVKRSIDSLYARPSSSKNNQAQINNSSNKEDFVEDHQDSYSNRSSVAGVILKVIDEWTNW